MQLGSPLGAAPSFKFVLQFYDMKDGQQEQVEVFLGQPVEMYVDEKPRLKITVVGIYESSGNNQQGVSDEERLPEPPEVSGP